MKHDEQSITDEALAFIGVWIFFQNPFFYAVCFWGLTVKFFQKITLIQNGLFWGYCLVFVCFKFYFTKMLKKLQKNFFYR